MTNIVFEYPIAFIILPLFLVCSIYCKAKVLSIYFPNIEFLKKAKSNISISQNISNILKWLIIIFLTISLASPIQEDDIVIKNDKGYEISLILDASGSMRESNKFEIVKNVVADFIDKRDHDKLGLSIFADFAYVAVPLTYDKKSIQRLLSKIDVGVAGVRRTALYEALFLSSNLFKTSKSKEKIAILLTDGIDNSDSIPKDVAIKTALKYGIKVYTIGVGRVGDFNPQVLQEIASKTDGQYFSANSIEELQNIYKTIDKLEKSEIKADKYVKKTYYYQYSLAISMIFLFIFLLLRYKESR
jgi:Ca-activated chloride channel family protein